MNNAKQSKAKNQALGGMIVQLSASTEPYSREAEQSVIGGLMHNVGAWPQTSAILSANDFFEVQHQKIWTTIKSVSTSGVHPDPVTVIEP